MLRGDDARERLLARLNGIRRLVLLGDVIELRQDPVRQALAAAAPVLRAVGRALGSDAEVVIVPGNHDHALLTPWLARRGAGQAPALGLETAVDWQDGEPLARVAEWLAPARVRVRYPGLWLRSDTYALHGHYGDRHTTVPMFERLGAGVLARLVGEADGAPARAEDYEAVLAPMYALVHGLAQARRPGLGPGSGPSARTWRAMNGSGRARRVLLRAAVPLAVVALDRAGLGPLRADFSGSALRRAGVAACAQVVARLGIDAPHVVFGHTHRAGPLPGDERGEWTAATGTQLLNTGCWVYERAFLGSRPERSPYRAGFAAAVGDAGPPELVNLLDP